MAKILEFRASQNQTAKPRSRRRRRSAEIVIFPGVRYERWPSQGDDRAASAEPVHRDTLVLAE